MVSVLVVEYPILLVDNVLADARDGRRGVGDSMHWLIRRYFLHRNVLIIAERLMLNTNHRAETEPSGLLSQLPRSRIIKNHRYMASC